MVGVHHAALPRHLRRAVLHAALALALSSASLVKKLDLSQNSVADDGAAALALALGGTSGLQHLLIGKNSIGDAGGAQIGLALSRRQVVRARRKGSSMP